MPQIAIVVPCFNESEILEENFMVLYNILENLKSKKCINRNSYICFIDDGSKDNTWGIIENLNKMYQHVKGIKLSRNFGHQNALLAGIYNNANVDCLITLDADLQDDPSAIEVMLDKHNEGFSIVYGVRRKRDEDTIFKRLTALTFYKLMSLLKVETIYNHADYRLIDHQVLKEITNFEETNLYLRGIFPLIGFKSTIIKYDRKKREGGESKYPLKKMISFAWNGITSFSVRPLRLVFVLGLVLFVISLFLIGWALIPVFNKEAVPGWASTVLPIFFFGGIQIASIGLIGEYLGKIYNEVKRRPRYIVEKKI